MTILPPEAYSHVFSRWIGATAALFADSGNVGDRLIREGEKVLFDHYNIKIAPRVATTRPDVAFWGGGGNMGSFYEYPRNERTHARTFAESWEIPLVVLPQSWMGFCNYPAMHNYCREAYSLKYRPQGILAPDLALAANFRSRVSPLFGDGFFLRIDQEQVKLGNIPAGNADPSVLVKDGTPQEYIDLAGRYNRIHTNRLHFAIAGIFAGCEVILYPNSYHKNRGVYDLWLHGRGVEWRDSL